MTNTLVCGQRARKFLTTKLIPIATDSTGIPFAVTNGALFTPINKITIFGEIPSTAP